MTNEKVHSADAGDWWGMANSGYSTSEIADSFGVPKRDVEESISWYEDHQGVDCDLDDCDDGYV